MAADRADTAPSRKPFDSAAHPLTNPSPAAGLPASIMAAVVSAGWAAGAAIGTSGATTSAVTADTSVGVGAPGLPCKLTTARFASSIAAYPSAAWVIAWAPASKTAAPSRAREATTAPCPLRRATALIDTASVASGG
uniref:Uncharacterized protein n=1 Tax=Mycobacterium marinum DL240490 TaxID=459420 RepID=B6CLN6_MYCMR|nr:hypothetical protein MUDP_048 [Mycobacterium marinum DL240490]